MGEVEGRRKGICVCIYIVFIYQNIPRIMKKYKFMIMTFYHNACPELEAMNQLYTQIDIINVLRGKGKKE